jgi:hypothetical protein
MWQTYFAGYPLILLFICFPSTQGKQSNLTLSNSQLKYSIPRLFFNPMQTASGDNVLCENVHYASSWAKSTYTLYIFLVRINRFLPLRKIKKETKCFLFNEKSMSFVDNIVNINNNICFRFYSLVHSIILLPFGTSRTCYFYFFFNIFQMQCHKGTEIVHEQIVFVF